MTERCSEPRSFEALVDYFSGDLPSEDEESLELHLFGCATCSELAAEVGRLVSSLPAILPPVITHEHLTRLRSEGTRVRQTPISAGGDADVTFDPDVDLLVHELAMDLGGAERVDVELLSLDGQSLRVLSQVPFDADQRGLCVTCQRHYRFLGFPADMRFRVFAVRSGERRAVGEYVVRHHFVESV